MVKDFDLSHFISKDGCLSENLNIENCRLTNCDFKNIQIEGDICFVGLEMSGGMDIELTRWLMDERKHTVSEVELMCILY